MAAGDIAWMAVCTALVMLMTPALAFFYAGLVRKKNMLTTLVQCLIVFAVVSLVWALWGYSLVFSGSLGGVIGDLSLLGLNGVTAAPNPAYGPLIPGLLQFAFQLKFAAITPALIIGAFAERTRLRPFLIFVVAWTTLIYCPIAHWIWNSSGWLLQLGVIDFAGGLVVHLSAGCSALAAAIVIGRRKGLERKHEFKPANVGYVVLGAGLLWFGWFGFNAGSALAANDIAVIAIVATNLAAAAGGISWLLVDWIRHKKLSAVGLAVGAVCGLAAITPASGYVTPLASIVIGLVAGILSNLVSHLRATRTRIDDALDVFSCHGLGGLWGVLAAGLFATVTINSAGGNGLLYGGTHLFVSQVIGIAVVAAFSFAGTFVLLKIINVFSKLRVTPGEEAKGLDRTTLGDEI